MPISPVERFHIQATLSRLGNNPQAASERFFTVLFRLAPETKALFSGSSNRRMTKYTAMLSTFNKLKAVERIAPALIALGKRHQQYGVDAAWLQAGRSALLASLEAVEDGGLSSKEKASWEMALDEVLPLLEQGLGDSSNGLETASPSDPSDQPAIRDPQLLEALGGESAIYDIHLDFYRRFFEDDWLGRFFSGKHETLLAKRQTEFLIACMGGPNHYPGETPAIVHLHMFLTEEMLEIREIYLRAAILRAGISEDLCTRWLAVDRAFNSGIAKQSPDECVMRCKGQMPIIVPRPPGYKMPKVDAV